MLLKILLNYIVGYVSIVVEGYYIERFINICISKKILMWNLKRKKSSILYVNMGIKDFKKVKEIARNTQCRIKIKRKNGLPFILNKYKKRKIFFVFLIIFFMIIFGISNFVWNIEIIGNTAIETSVIQKELEETGLKIGKLKSKINTKNIINQMRLKRDDIAWIGIKLKGTNAIVEIVERDKKPEIINENEYCNIISKKEGIITKINVQDGTALVKPGDIVKNETILVAGWIEGKYTGTRYVHAKGEIQAKVWYSKKEKMKLNIEKNEETGEFQNAYFININNFKINLTKTLPKFQKYDTICDNKRLKIFSNFYFPIELGKITYKELKTKNVTYTQEEAKQILINKIEEELKKEIENVENIVNAQINFKQEDNQIEVEVIYEVLENIGTKEKIIL